MPRISRFKLKDSDRSGFKFFEIELVKDGPFKVSGEEFDTPPPSRIPLGGEGDLAAGETRTNANFSGTVSTVTATPALSDNPVVYILAAGGVTPSFVHPWMQISGSNAAVIVSAVPQIARGREGNVLTLECVDSAVTIAHGSANALNLMGSTGTLRLDSGMVITFVYNTANQAWNEASRYRT